MLQSDLGDFKAYAKENKGFKYLLLVLNAFSKMCYLEPLKDKRGLTVTSAFKKILERLREKKIKLLVTDDGKEYKNQHFKKLMADYNIQHYSVRTLNKAAMAERLVKTVKHKLYRRFHMIGNYEWISALKDVETECNSTVHKTIKMRPIDVRKKHEPEILKRLEASEPAEKKSKPKFKVGQYVRISKHKNIFAKGYTPNWSTEIFRIVKIQNTTPVVFLLNDLKNEPILGSFYEQELKRTKFKDIYLIDKIIKKEKNRMYVHFLGFPDSEKAWVKREDGVRIGKKKG